MEHFLWNFWPDNRCFLPKWQYLYYFYGSILYTLCDCDVTLYTVCGHCLQNLWTKISSCQCSVLLDVWLVIRLYTKGTKKLTKWTSVHRQRPNEYQTMEPMEDWCRSPQKICGFYQWHIWSISESPLQLGSRGVKECWHGPRGPHGRGNERAKGALLKRVQFALHVCSNSCRRVQTGWGVRRRTVKGEIG